VSKFLDDLEHGAEVDTKKGTDSVAEVGTNQGVDSVELLDTSGEEEG
jgi:hypothetical protein